MLIRYDAKVRLLVVTKGHPYDRTAFCALFDSLNGISWTHVEQPAAARLIACGGGQDHDLILFYDVPGIQFRTPNPPDLIEPDEGFKAGFRALLASGKPLLFLHHAIAGWPLWDEYAEAIGARFFYQPGRYKGWAHPDSGYLFPVTYRAEPVGAHPVTQGLEDGFELTDELYLFELLEEVVPLLRAKADFDPARFHSARNALAARMWTSDGWTPPRGTDLIGWAKVSGRSPTVTLQCGNDGATFANPAFRKLLRNALDWLLSPAAREWAAGAPAQV